MTTLNKLPEYKRVLDAVSESQGRINYMLITPINEAIINEEEESTC